MHLLRKTLPNLRIHLFKKKCFSLSPRCARDVNDGKTDLDCFPQYGNYTDIQSLGTYEMCVDEDGVPGRKRLPNSAKFSNKRQAKHLCSKAFLWTGALIFKTRICAPVSQTRIHMYANNLWAQVLD